MYYPIGSGPLFRVASATVGNAWPQPVRGEGAYYVPKGGNRYSRTHQLTVYCAEDPLVAITEGAFYQALHWQNAIAESRSRGLGYPLRSEHLFWAFQIDPIPAVIDMESAVASSQFRYPPHLLLNPSREYGGTQDVADDVRTYVPPPSSGDPRPEGMKIPSVRTPYTKGHQPYHLALFVMSIPNAVPFDQRSQLVAKMRIEYEFLTHQPRSSVSYSHARIHWDEPRFRVTSIPGEQALSPIPIFPGRPNARKYVLNQWYRIRILF